MRSLIRRGGNRIPWDASGGPQARNEEPAAAQAAVGADGAGHRLRRGGGDLDAGDRRRDRAATRRSRSEQLGATNIIIRSVKPSDEAQADRRPAVAILNYGLKYDDYDRIIEPCRRSRKVLPIREIRKQIRHLNHCLDGRVVGTTHDYAEFNRLRDRPRAGSSPRPTTRSSRTSPCSPTRRPRPCSPTKTRSASRSSSGPTTTRSSASPRSAQQLGGDRRQPGCAGLQQGRLHPARTPAGSGSASGSSNSRSGSMAGRGDPALADHAPGRLDRRGPADRPDDRGGLRALPPQEGRRDDRPLRPAAGRPSARPASSASSWARSRRSRCWSAASAS